MILSALLPVGITRERLTDLIPSIRRRRWEALVMAHFVMVPYQGLGGTVCLGVEQHMGRDFVTLTKDILADDGTLLPCHLESTRRTVWRTEATCLAAGSSAGNETARGALE